MLVLSRKEGERLVIGDNITLIVSKIAGNRVTVGIEAPADVKIFRGELKDEQQQKHLPKVVPLRRAATVTIDLEQALGSGTAEFEVESKFETERQAAAM